MKAPYTAFGQTRLVEVEVYTNDDGKIESTEWDDELWVERGEDWYAMMSPQLRNKRVRIIRRENWLRGEKIKDATDESHLPVSEQSLVYRLRKRAEIRRNIVDRKSVQENKPDRIADLLEEAANEIDRLKEFEWMYEDLQK
jgi:hypothetical protein